MAHLHGVIDLDKHFVIDAATREITNQSEKITLMQNDHNSERFTFEIPREIDGHDMSLCNVVRVHYLNIDSTTKAQNPGFYDVEDLQISPDDESVIIGSWLISANATKNVGNLNFTIRFKCVADDGLIEYAWSSAIFKGISVGQSYNHTGAVAEEYADIFLQWQARIEALEQFGTGNGSGSGLTEKQAKDLAANTEARHTHTNAEVLELFSRDELGSLLFNGESIEGIETPSASAAVIAAQTVAALLDDQGATMLASFESPTEASDLGSDLAQYIAEATVPPEEGGIKVIYAPPEDGELVFAKQFTQEQQTISVKAGGLYVFYMGAEWETVYTSTFGAGILELFKEQIFADSGLQDKINQIISEGKYASIYDLVNYRHISKKVPSDDVSYSNSKLNDKSGTIKGALDEVISSVMNEGIGSSELSPTAIAVHTVVGSLQDGTETIITFTDLPNQITTETSSDFQLALYGLLNGLEGYVLYSPTETGTISYYSSLLQHKVSLDVTAGVTYRFYTEDFANINVEVFDERNALLAVCGAYEERIKSFIPGKTSQLENDSGFITKADIPTDESYEFIGQTPLTLEKGGNIKLVADGKTSYSMVSPTVWNFDNAEFTSQNISLSTDKGYYEFTVTGSPTAYHQSWIQFVISGLEIGKSYTLLFDTDGLIQDYDNQRTWCGSVTIWSGTTTSGTLIKSGLQLRRDGKFNFTPTEESILIRYYATRDGNTPYAGFVGHFNKMYLNYVDTSEELTEIYSNSGTFNDVATFKAIPAKALITTEPTAGVYRKAPTDITLTQSDTPADAKVTGEKIAEVKSYLPLYGKTIVNFGDSIFGNAQPPVDISTHLANKTGATVYNCGFGGCRMSQHISGWNAFSMYSLANAITSGNYAEQDEAIANTDVGLPERFAPSLERLKGIDFSKVDIVTIAYGTNDFTSNIDMDNEEDAKDTTTLAGALRYSIEQLLTAYPNIRIFILSTTYRFWIDKENGNAFLHDSNTYTNANNVKLTDYNAKLKEVAEEYNLPFVDDYNIGIGKFNRYQYFPVTDGTHHNETGRKLIASHLAKELY